MSIPLIDPHTIAHLSSQWAALVLTVALKGMVLLGLALLLHTGLRRGPAAARHLVWTGAVAGLLALPLLGAALPGWSVPGLSMPTVAEPTVGPSTTTEAPPYDPGTVAGLWRLDFEATAPSKATELLAGPASDPTVGPRVLSEGSTTSRATYLLRADEDGRFRPGATALPPALDDAAGHAERAMGDPTLLLALVASARDWSPWTWALLVWETGVLLVAGWFALGWWHLRALRRSSRRIGDPEWHAVAREVAAGLGLRRVPELRRTDDAMTPLTWGVLRPVVLLPASADDWSHERRRDVLCHEFAHVQRRDVATQLVAQIACTLFWFHPLPWIAAARMRLERERACDDRVLLAGSRASSYAGHLLDMARSLRSEHSLAAATIGMARRSQLGERMDSLLDDTPRGRRLGRRARLALIVLVVLPLLPLAALRPHALQAAPPENEDTRRFPDRVTPPIAPAPDTVFTPRTPDTRFEVRAPRLPSVLRRVVPDAPSRFEVGLPSVPRAPRVGALAFGSDAVVRVGSGGDLFVSGSLWKGEGTLDDYELDVDDVSFRYRGDDLELEVEIEGRLRIAEDESDVEWMHEDAYFDLYREEGRERRRMELVGQDDGVIERTYWVGGRRAEIDDEARAWFAEALQDFLTRAGVAVVPRVERWVEEDGVEATVDRIEDLDGDFTAARYWSALVGHDTLDSDQRALVLERMGRSLDSDFETNRVLAANMAVLLAEPDLVDEVVAVIGTLDSDFERRRALEMALSVEGLDEATLEQVLVLVGEMDSDFEKAETLRAFPLSRLRSTTGQRAALEALRSMDSDFEKARSLQFFLREDLGRGNAPVIMEMVGDIDSDFERARVLMEAMPLALDDDEARAQMWRTIEAMDSDFEKAKTIHALVPRVAEDETMTLEALEVVETIGSDFEKARVLREFADAAAASERVHEACMRIAETIDSDHEYGQVVRALRRARR